MRKDIYPHNPTAKRGSPQTAFDAAEAIAEVAKSIRAKVKQTIYGSGPRGLIADEVAALNDLSVYQVRARIAELHAAKEVAPSGRKAPGASGLQTTVWVAKCFAPPEPEADQLELPVAA